MNAPILSFTTKNADALHAEAILLLNEFAAARGLRIRQAGGTVSGDRATLKFEFVCTSPEAEKLEFAKNAVLFNCKPEDYGRVATINREEVTLTGFNLSRSKFAVRCRRNKDGAVVSYPEAVLSKYFHTGAVEKPSLDALREVPAPAAFRPAVIVR